MYNGDLSVNLSVSSLTLLDRFRCNLIFRTTLKVTGHIQFWIIFIEYNLSVFSQTAHLIKNLCSGRLDQKAIR